METGTRSNDIFRAEETEEWDFRKTVCSGCFAGLECCDFFADRRLQKERGAIGGSGATGIRNSRKHGSGWDSRGDASGGVCAVRFGLFEGESAQRGQEADAG